MNGMAAAVELPPVKMATVYRRAAIGHREAGPADGPKVLLLHGIGSNSRAFRRQFPAFAERYHVVAWDAPGYGGSEDPRVPYALDDFAAAAEALLDALRWPAAHLVGHSFGGVVAQALYHRNPARVLSLALSDANAGSGSLPEPERSERVRRRLEDIATLEPREMARRRAPNLVSPGAPAELVAEIADVMAQVRAAGYGAAARVMGATDLRTQLPTIAVPTLVIHGEQDTVIGIDTARELAQAIPGARLEILAGAGHLSNQEAPDAYNAAVLRFLEEVAWT